MKSRVLNQWKNMKNKAKKSEFSYRRARNMTGGGPPPPRPPLEDQELIEGIPHEFSIDSNCHDSDSIYIKKQESTQNVCIPSPVSAIQKELEPQKIDDPSPVLISPAARASSQASLPICDRPGPSGLAPEKKNKEVYLLKSDCCAVSHEHEIYMLARTAREEAMLRDKEAHECKMMYERELHERRMTIMSLEEEYWRIKIRKLKEKE
ncbi:unnamed protein product [Euphydryas editha]|uniref:Uncharacterized protein n=1 Tax=Euphydryas editha TaxID=104508 RepID=A0AAU9UWQ6_EUPED|nr:unnamed protein product [Euphydryas editha]